MANLIQLLAALVVVCVATTSACDMQKCEKAPPAKATDVAAMCKYNMDKLKCYKELKCEGTFKTTIDSLVAQMAQSVGMCGKEPAATGGNKPDGQQSCSINFAVCASKKECEMFKCVNKVKKDCKEENWWSTMYKGEFKSKYDDFADKCGCGSLKPSLLFVLVSVIGIYLRSLY